MEDAMAFDYAGLTHNSSCETYAVKHFMGRMGFRDQGIWAFYNQGSTAFADSFLSVKYFASRFDSTEKPYEDSFSTDEIYVEFDVNVERANRLLDFTFRNYCFYPD